MELSPVTLRRKQIHQFSDAWISCSVVEREMAGNGEQENFETQWKTYGGKIVLTKKHCFPRTLTW